MVLTFKCGERKREGRKRKAIDGGDRHVWRIVWRRGVYPISSGFHRPHTIIIIIIMPIPIAFSLFDSIFLLLFFSSFILSLSFFKFYSPLLIIIKKNFKNKKNRKLLSTLTR